MVLAEDGWPPLGLVIVTLIGGTLAAGGANAINMYVDRDIDALMQRTSERPLVTGVIAPRNALVVRPRPRGGGLRRALGRRQPPLRPARPRRGGVLRRRVHDLAEAHEHAQHRHRRCRWRRPRAGRLGGRHRFAGLGTGRPVRRHVLLDAAALLGAGHPLRRRLPGGRRADAAGRRPARRRGAPDGRLHGGDGGRHARADPGRRSQLDLCRRGRRARCRVPRGDRRPRRAIRRRRRACACSPTASRTSRCCSPHATS